MKILKSITAALVALCAVASAQDLVVGGKNFTEQYLVAEMTKQLLEKHGFNVEVRAGLGSNIVRQAQENGEVDIYWEYTGTSLTLYNKIKEQLTPQQSYDRVKKLDAEKGLVWLAPSNADNTYALAVRRETAEETNMRTLEDLAAAYNRDEDWKFGMDTEFIARPDGLPGLEKAYEFRIPRKNRISMEPGLLYNALQKGQLDVGIVFATDGRIAAFDFVVLKDVRGFFPAYQLVPVVRQEVLTKHPQLESLLNSISAPLNDTIMQQLNAAVDIEKESVEKVSKEFLQQHNLL